MKTFYEFYVSYFTECQKDENEMLRRGQIAFNMLSIQRPDLAEQIRGTDNDPFYSNFKLPEFWHFVAENW